MCLDITRATSCDRLIDPHSKREGYADRTPKNDKSQRNREAQRFRDLDQIAIKKRRDSRTDSSLDIQIMR